MTVVVRCQNISKEYGDSIILRDINLEIMQGQKLGVVGANGAGKTTLANIVAGRLKPTSGLISFPKEGINIGYMQQSVSYTDLKETLSGGEKTKAVLTKVFYESYDLLILDEPTNHLDAQGIKWLIKMIKKYPEAIMIISHDRYFLDQCVAHIAEINEGKLKLYKGNYTFYRNEKKRQHEAALHQYVQEEKIKGRIREQINQLENWSDRAHRESAKKAIQTGNKFGGKEYNRVKAKKMDKAVKSRIKRLEKIEIESSGRPDEEKSVLFSLGEAGKAGQLIVEAKNISKKYNQHTLFEESSFYIKRGEKVGVYGANGCGKSTLIKGMIGEVEIEGKLQLSMARKVGYMSQDVTGLDDSKTILELFHIINREEQSKLRTALAQIGFGSEALKKKVSILSLGERMKLKLLLMIREGCEVLILDEPTNHIDLHVREQLEETLIQYDGTIILVTHDRYMLEKVCNKLLIFENNKIIRYEYGLEEYFEKRLQGGETGEIFLSGEKMSKNQKKKALEERMRIENELACIIGNMSQYKPETKEYIQLEEQYQSLMEELLEVKKVLV